MKNKLVLLFVLLFARITVGQAYIVGIFGDGSSLPPQCQAPGPLLSVELSGWWGNNGNCTDGYTGDLQKFYDIAFYNGFYFSCVSNRQAQRIYGCSNDLGDTYNCYDNYYTTDVATVFRDSQISNQCTGLTDDIVRVYYCDPFVCTPGQCV